MKLIVAHRLVSMVVAAGICLGAIAVGIGVTLSTEAMAQTVENTFDPQLGDYAKAQRDLEQHLDQRLRMHLAQAAKRATRQ